MPPGPLWVFGYGSLMWNPGFDPAEQRIARAVGWRRAFCMRSIHHRGTPERPGLVLALDAAPGGLCHGLALLIPEPQRPTVLAALRARELVSSAYHEICLTLETDQGPIAALGYAVDRAHAQYCGRLSPEAQARIIARAVGGRGPNVDYLTSTAAHLHALGLPDPDLDWLVARVQELGRKRAPGAGALYPAGPAG